MKRMLTMILMCALLVCCTHKDLCYDHPHVSNISVAFNWVEEPEKFPGSMSVYFFNDVVKERVPLRFEFTDPSGGKIRLNKGTYRAISVNSDTRSNYVVDGNDYDTFCVSTKDASSLSGLSMFGLTHNDLPRAKGSEDERMSVAPESFWYSSLTDFEVEYRTDRGMQLEIKPQIVTHNIEITNVANLKWVYGVSATMSGLSGGFYPGRGELSEEAVTISFEARMDKEKNTISGSFTSFGHCPGETVPHYLKIYAVLADNTWWDFTYNVTDLIHNSPDPYNISIQLDQLPIPKPVANGGGFKPTVGGWNSVEIELQM